MAWRVAELIGREAERRVLDQLVEAVRAGAGRALVVHGEPGVGKTALLEYLGGSAPGCRIERATGETARRRTVAAGQEDLTAQEAQIARLAFDGLSNPKIGTGTSSARTPSSTTCARSSPKLGITSRSQLDRVLPGNPASADRTR